MRKLGQRARIGERAKVRNVEGIAHTLDSLNG
jgi:hypothetical protein